VVKRTSSLDANILLRLLMPDLPAQTERALALIEQGGQFQVADTAVIETIFVLERFYEIPRPELSAIIRALVGNPSLNLNRPLFQESLTLFEKHPKLSIEDCCLAVYAKLNQALPLWTFDSKLAAQSGGLAKLVPN
jgi:predicted nucleic-acid-binding protein